MRPAINTPARVVALAASAGGFQAVSALLRYLPSDFAAALLVVQHRAAEPPARLSTSLSVYSRLPVRKCDEGQALEGEAYASRRRIAMFRSGRVRCLP